LTAPAMSVGCRRRDVSSKRSLLRAIVFSVGGQEQ
jgi:hypothetical protein